MAFSRSENNWVTSTEVSASTRSATQRGPGFGVAICLSPSTRERFKRSRVEGDKHIATPKPGPRCVALRVLADTSVDVTQLFSLRENAIAKEPGSRYVKPWRCVSRLGLANGGL